MRFIPKRKLNRLNNYNYSRNGYYFVTVCTLNRVCWFGNIVDNKMKLSNIGLIVNKYWRQIPQHYENIRIDEFIIMPNHIHGIIVINRQSLGTEQYIKTVGTEHCSVPTNHKNYGLLSKIVKSFKNVVTNDIKQNIKYKHVYWQRSYYDRIIRNEIELNIFRKYIKNNPQNWKKDRNKKMAIFSKI